MSAQTEIADAKRFAAAYKPSDSDHPDLESRVVMFRRAVASEKGTGRTVGSAVHARTLLRHLRQTGVEIPKAAKKSTPSRSTSGKAGS